MPTLKESRLTVLRARRAVLAASLAVVASVWCHDAEAPTARALQAEVECPAVVDVRQEGTLTMQAGRTVPPKPDKDWKRPPCGELQVEVNGACWVLPAKPDGTLPKPPCPPTLFEHQGRCLQPVAAGKRPDTSIKALGD